LRSSDGGTRHAADPILLDVVPLGDDEPNLLAIANSRELSGHICEEVDALCGGNGGKVLAGVGNRSWPYRHLRVSARRLPDIRLRTHTANHKDNPNSKDQRLPLSQFFNSS